MAIGKYSGNEGEKVLSVVMFCLRNVTVVGAAHGLSITECLWLGPGPIWQQGPPSRGAARQ